MSGVRVLGLVLAAVGVVAAIAPGWFGPLTRYPQPPADVFEVVESRVRGGMILGVGLIFLAVPALRPWTVSIPAAILWFVAGALIARLLGIAVDGAVPKQWLWVAVEAGLMGILGAWLWRAGGPAA
ncbi:MAG: DUF4345 family protein [Myxococcales bacterium]|nr:DUF4345 family protein [Myxococcales bacterium]